MHVAYIYAMHVEICNCAFFHVTCACAHANVHSHAGMNTGVMGSVSTTSLMNTGLSEEHNCDLHGTHITNDSAPVSDHLIGSFVRTCGCIELPSSNRSGHSSSCADHDATVVYQSPKFWF